MTELKDQPVDIFNSLYSNSLISERLRIVVEILTVYNPRINEILQCKWMNFYPDQFLILPGLKSSRDVIIRDRIILNKITNLKANSSSFIFYPVNYNTVYNFIKSNYGHLFNGIKIKKNKKITHAFRYLNVKAFANDKLITEILHHNSIRSAKFYKR